MSGEVWRHASDGIGVACRLTPRGGRDAVDGVARLSDGTSVLLVRVRSAPENGRANEALRAFLAATFDVPVSRVRLAGGAKSRLKQVAVTGDPGALVAAVKALSSPA